MIDEEYDGETMIKINTSTNITRIAQQVIFSIFFLMSADNIRNKCWWYDV